MLHNNKLEEFKAGDLVWISAVSFHKSGRLKYNVRPTRTTIKSIDYDTDSIVIDPGVYFIGNRFYVSSYEPTLTIDNVISRSREESIEKYNIQLKNSVEERRNNLIIIEKRILGFLI